MKCNKITQQRLKEVLDYNKKTGVFTWRKKLSNRIKVGGVAGSIDLSGYILISVDGVVERGHRLAFLYVSGYLPEHEVDHKNGVTGDNRWENLKHTKHSCNLQNQKTRTTNTSGFPGVSWDKVSKKWTSKIMLNGKTITIGRFVDILEAALARYTVEVNCSEWNCNERSEIFLAIKRAWSGLGKP